jgi:hypothetical protein
MQDKIKQLKTLLATKDARQMRKDGEALLKAWKEEEDRRDNRVYQKVGNRYEPIGHFHNRDWLTDGVWVVQSNGSSLFNGTHYAQEFGIVKVGSNKPADFSTIASQYNLFEKIIDLLQHQRTEVDGDVMHYPSAQDIAKQIMQLLNNPDSYEFRNAF